MEKENLQLRQQAASPLDEKCEIKTLAQKIKQPERKSPLAQKNKELNKYHEPVSQDVRQKFNTKQHQQLRTFFINSNGETIKTASPKTSQK